MATSTERLTPPPDYDPFAIFYNTYANNSMVNNTNTDSIDFVNRRFERPEAEHQRTNPLERRVKIIIKDAHDDKGPGMIFEMRYLQSLKVAFNCFKAACCKTCRAVDEIRFKTVQKRIEETDTPKKLGLKHNTTIEFRAWSNVPGLQCSACKIHGYPKTDGAVKPSPPNKANKTGASTKPETITLQVKDQTGFETNVKMLNSVSMEYLMDTYAERSMRVREHVRFLFDGEILIKSETPKQLGLTNNDIIDVFIEQLGG